MLNAALLLGLALIIAGTALVSVPAGFIVAGFGLVAVVWMIDQASATPRPPGDEE